MFEMRKSYSLVIVLLMILSACLLLTPNDPQTQAINKAHILTGSTCVFYGNISTWASQPLNWAPEINPGAGDNVIFDARSGSKACTWDIPGNNLASFSMNAGYSGVITIQGATNWGTTGNIILTAGTFTSIATSTITCGGNFLQNGATITSSKLNLIMTGVDTTFTLTSAITMTSFRASASCTINANFWTLTFTIDPGVTMTLTNTKIIYLYTSASLAYSNSGVIAGAGTMEFYIEATASSSIAPGVINAPVRFEGYAGTGANGSWTLSGNAIFGSTLTVASSHATYTCTLNLNGYSLSAASITIGTRGIITAGTSTITCSGNWDSSAGTFTAGTSTLVMSGTTKTVKTANTNGALYNLQESGTTTTSSSVNVTHSLTVDTGKTFTIGAAKTVDFNCSNGGTYSNLGTIAGATGTLMEYSFSTGDKILPFGIVNAPVRVRATSAANANRTLTLTSDRILGSTLLVNSDHATYTMTIDARTVYLGAVGAITEGTRGDILYATFTFISSPGFGGGVQTGHSYTYETNLSTTASPGQVYTFASNATWLQWDSTELAVYGTPDSVFGGHWYYVNISVADGMLSTYQNYTVLVVPIETLQDYIPLLMGLLFGFGLLVVGLRFRELWILAGPIWIICGMTIFITYGVPFLLISVGLGIVLLFKGVSPYL